MIHNKIYDIIRKKEVPNTPEERVRQMTINFLIDALHVPKSLIAVEFALSSIDSKTSDRVDLLVQDFKSNANLRYPWLLVECKAEGEYTWQNLQVQLNKYLQVLTPKYIMLSLGHASKFFKLNKNSGQFERINELPKFTEQ